MGSGTRSRAASGTSLSLTVHPDEHVVCTITNTDNSSARVEPILECVRSGGDGLSTAVWGYTNPNNYPVRIEYGNDNHFTPEPSPRLDQPDTFAGGTNSTVFVTEFDAAAGPIPGRSRARAQPLQPTARNAKTSSRRRLTHRRLTHRRLTRRRLTRRRLTPADRPTPIDPPPEPPFVPDPPTDISVTKTGNPTTVTIGERITWTMTVTNNSSVTAIDVAGVRLQERFSFRSKVISIEPSQGACTLVSCDLGTIAPGASATVVAVSEATQIGPVVNAVEVSASQGDANPADNTASALVTVIAPVEVPTSVRCGSLAVAPHRLFAARTAASSPRRGIGSESRSPVSWYEPGDRNLSTDDYQCARSRPLCLHASAGRARRFAGTGPLTNLRNPRRCASVVGVLRAQGHRPLWAAPSLIERAEAASLRTAGLA